MNPTAPLPDGYVIEKEIEQVKEYKIPVAARNNIGEAKAFAMEIIDEILGRSLGIHLLEPQISMREKSVVKLAN